MMKLPNIPPSSAPNVKHLSIRLNAEQAKLFTQHCVRARITTQQATIEALAAMIEGFPR
jgi:hypothetical protein